MQNNLFESGGVATIILRCQSETTINGRTYAANEPYTVLRDVGVSISYTDTTSNATKGTTKKILSHTIADIDNIYVWRVPLTTKVAHLLMPESGKSAILARNTILTSTDGETLWLPTMNNVLNIFLTDNNGEPVDFTLEDNCLKGNFGDGEFLCFFDEEIDGTVFALNKKHTNYMIMDILFSGNVDKRSTQNMLRISGANLTSTATIQLDENSLLGANLVFNVVKNSFQPENYMVLGN